MAQTLTIANTEAAVIGVRDFVATTATALGIADATAERMTLILEELASNVVKYGFDDDTRHDIEISLWREDESFCALMVDDGRPFDPLSAGEPDLDADLEERGIGGLGIHLVRNMADGLDYERTEGRNRLTIRVAG